MLFLLSKITNPEHTSQFKLVRDASTNRVNGLLINKTIPVTFYNNLLRFRDTDKKFEQQGGLLKLITNKIYNVGLAKFPDEKTMYEFAKEMHFDEGALGDKSTQDKSPIKLLKSPAIMAGSLREPKRRRLSSDLNELCDRQELIVQEKQSGNYSNIFNEEIVAIADKQLEYKCIPTKQHTFLLLK